MGLWRCQNPECSEDPAGRLIFDFEADTPTCPKCGANPNMPEHVHTIIKRETIHFLVADKKGALIGHGSRYRVACDSTITAKNLGRATGECVATTCPKCIKSADFAAAALDQGFQGKAEKTELEWKKTSTLAPEPADSI